jgi:transposase
MSKVEFDQVIPNGCGIDVHKKKITATIAGDGIKTETREYPTFTKSLVELKEWLLSNKITQVAMESTGIYWKPLFNILESDIKVILVNARHVRSIPGKKLDKWDSRRLTKYLLAGFLQPSFIPELKIRELRDLYRYKTKLTGARTAEKNRILKFLEDSNIKLSSVITDVFGASGRAILNALINGQTDEEELCKLGKGSVKKKKEELKLATENRITEHHIFMLKMIMQNLDRLQQSIDEIDKEINRIVKDYEQEIELLDTIPGVDRDGAIGIISEIGVDMSFFPEDKNIASWAGMSPGNNESAGKKKSGKTTHGNKYLSALLVELAWGATHTKNTFLSKKYKNLVVRRGKKKALIAIGHKILCSAYHMIKNKEIYKEFDPEIHNAKKKEYIKNYHLLKLQSIGYTVELKEKVA